MTDYRRLLISASAKDEIREARRWWRRERTKAASALTDELRDAFALLLQHPMAGRAIDDDPRFNAVRRLSLNRTHHYLFYEVSSSVAAAITGHAGTPLVCSTRAAWPAATTPAVRPWT